MNAAPLVQRILSDAPLPEWHNAPQQVKDTQPKLLALCAKYGVKLSDVAIKYAVDHPAIASTIVGMWELENVKQNIAAVDFNIPEGLLEEIDTLVAPVKNCMWFEGKAENNIQRK